jgi:hypothetical protein
MLACCPGPDLFFLTALVAVVVVAAALTVWAPAWSMGKRDRT